MNSHFISFVLLLVFAMTVVNLFYKFGLLYDDDDRSHPAEYPATDDAAPDPIDVSLCGLTGYRCPDAGCDCAAICGGTHGYDRMTVVEGEEVTMRGVRYSPGTYCVPRGWSDCNLRSSSLVYTASGWLCRNRALWRGNYRTACKNPKSRDDDANALWDRLTRTRVEDPDRIVDLYETLPGDGTLRYGCRCDSLDARGNRMVEAIPFVCSVDHCVAELRNVPGLGWRNGTCECGPYPREDPTDPASRCVGETTRMERNDAVLLGRVDCTTRDSLVARPVYCSPDDRVSVLRIRKNVSFSNDPDDYLRAHEEDAAILLPDGTTDREHRAIVDEAQENLVP